MKKYHLAFVIESYFEYGGLQRDMFKFAKSCANEGHHVTIFTSNWDGPKASGLSIFICNFKASSNHLRIRKIERFVARLKEQNKFDCVIGFNRVAGLDVYFGGDRCLKQRLIENKKYFLRFLPRYRNFLDMEEVVFGKKGNCDILLISTEEMLNIKAQYQTDPKRIHLLPPGIDRQRIIDDELIVEKKEDFRKNLGLNIDDFMIITVGSGFRTKGIDRVIKAISALPDAYKEKIKYVVVGIGKTQEFQSVADKVGIGNQILFTGGRSDVGCFYSSADLLIHPARTETAGYTLLEAMIVGLPVMVTENCGYAKYVKEASGGIVCLAPFVQSKLNAALLHLLNNNKLLKSFSKNGSAFCEDAQIYNMVVKCTELIIKRASKNRSEI